MMIFDGVMLGYSVLLTALAWFKFRAGALAIMASVGAACFAAAIIAGS